jgi:putative transposase
VPGRTRFGEHPSRWDISGNVAYDFVAFTETKRVEKLRYMYRNPVRRGLVLKPEEWLWSSFRHYAYGERGPVLVNETRKAELHIRKIS